VKKKTAVSAVLFCLLLMVPSASYASDDITGHYFESSMRALISDGVMAGYNDGTYRPDEEVTRAEFTTFLVSALDLNGGNAAPAFSDVEEGDWFYSPIAIATSENLIGGYPDGTFKPNEPISRQEMAAIINRSLNQNGAIAGEAPLVFADVEDINPMFRTSISQLVYLDVMAGKTVNGELNFMPHDNTTRGETSALIVRMLDVLENPQEVTRETHYDRDYNTFIDTQMTRTPKVDGAGQYHASQELVEYYANPSNFNQGTNGFMQFLVLSEPTDVHAEDLNEGVLSGQGILEGEGEAFIEAGKQEDLNEVYLISHALHETGNGTSTLATGIPVDENGQIVAEDQAEHMVYNMYGYGAVDSDPLQGGATYAFENEWFTPSAAIIGGAEDIANNYINQGQDTLYKMRWNPASPNAYPQYATHVEWASAQADRMAEIYSTLDNYVLRFDVPRFNNQSGQTEKPTGEDQYRILYTHAGEPGYTTAADGVNLRSGPTTSFSTVANLPEGTTFTVLGENGGWYKIDAGDVVGWVSGNYIELGEEPAPEPEVPDVPDTPEEPEAPVEPESPEENDEATNGESEQENNYQAQNQESEQNNDTEANQENTYQAQNNQTQEEQNRQNNDAEQAEDEQQETPAA